MNTNTHRRSRDRVHGEISGKLLYGLGHGVRAKCIYAWLAFCKWAGLAVRYMVSVRFEVPRGFQSGQ